MNLLKKKLWIFVFTLLLCDAAFAGSIIINPVSGFTDTTAVSPVGGNSGTTLGAQRANVFAQAASIWTSILQPSVNITVDAEYSSSLYCTGYAAVLGSGGATNSYRDFAGAIYSSTWYPFALRDQLANALLGGSQVTTTFNSKLDNDAGCLIHWYYGFDHNPGSDQVDFLQLVVHEMSHGLGFVTWINLTTGAKNFNSDDIYMKFLRDNSLNKNWPAMTNAERVTSAKDSGDLVWTGSHVQHVNSTLTNGLTNGYPRLYAPTTLSTGSSVVHWDSNVTYLGNLHELMEYQPHYYYDMALTVALMRDLGWSSGNYDFDNDGTNDEPDEFPYTNAANLDSDNDSMVDAWLAGSGCSGTTCAGLTLDGDDDSDGVQDIVDANSLDNSNTNEINLPLNSSFKGVKYSSSNQQQ